MYYYAWILLILGTTIYGQKLYSDIQNSVDFSQENIDIEEFVDIPKSRMDCPGHTLCLPETGSNCGSDSITGIGFSESEKSEILEIHNDYRQQIASGKYGFPQAANMMKLNWNEDLAQVAQRWADQCTFSHDSYSARKTSDFEIVGQNVYLQKISKRVPGIKMSKAIKKWFGEIKKFKENQINPFKFSSSTGHFTQVVWASTSQVGCGWSNFMDGSKWKRIVVCNYGPGGNFNGKSLYINGSPCSACPDQSGGCENGLCL